MMALLAPFFGSSKCIFPGCSKPVYQHSRTGPSQYCGRAHRDQAHAQSNAPTQSGASAQTQPHGALPPAQAAFGGAMSAPPPAQAPLTATQGPAQVPTFGGPSPPAHGSSQMCKNCHSRPVFVDGGKAHDFCGRTCVNAYNSGHGGAPPPPHHGQSVSAVGASRMCQNCHTKPCFVENGRAHDFCGRRCAAAFNQPPGQGHPQQPGAHARSGQQAVGGGMCKVCQVKPVFVENGRAHDFCGRRCANANPATGGSASTSRHGHGQPPTASHAQQGQLCKLCLTNPVRVENGRVHDFCGKKCAATYRTVSSGSQASSSPAAKHSAPLLGLHGAHGASTALHAGVTPPTLYNAPVGPPAQTILCKNCYARPAVIEYGEQTKFCQAVCEDAYDRRMAV